MNRQLLLDPDSTWHGIYCYALVYVGLLWLGFRITTMLRRTNPAEAAAGGVPPGSRGLPLIGETLQFMVAANSDKGFYDFVRVRRLRYGECFKTSIFGETQVFVSSTESAKEVLNGDPGRFMKRYIKSIAKVVGEQSLLCAPQQTHKLIRHRLSNLFSSTSMALFIRHFDQLVVAALSRWEHKATIVVLDEALSITIKAICKMLMSLEREEELEELQKHVALVCEAMLAFPLRLPFSRFHSGLKARERIMGALEKIIDERRRGIGAHEDFLQHLVMEHDQNEAPSLTDAQIKDNILTMIIAGQDTTSSSITWMVKYLHENQEVLHTLKVEQLALAKKVSHKPFLTIEDLNDMPYASKVVKESLRMASIVSWFPRLALQDCEIHGYNIKKGWSVNIDARAMHFDPSLYSEPDKFIPSRFDDDSKPYSFLAFGQGGRTCLGMNWARAMMLVFLHRLVTTYMWELIDLDSSVEKWALFARLKTGCPVRVTPIRDSEDNDENQMTMDKAKGNE
ncbi:(+)-abscisic acid 8'-hydroxylase [Bertholletia excelsa]